MNFEQPSVQCYTFEELLDKDGVIVYTNVGYSMMPLLRQRYKCGDKYILHRILKVMPDGYLIAGDHNTFTENDVTDSMILGVMICVYRDGKAVTPENIWYKLYVHLWCDCYPVRMQLIRLKYKARRVLRKIKRGKRKKNTAATGD